MARSLEISDCCYYSNANPAIDNMIYIRAVYRGCKLGIGNYQADKQQDPEATLNKTYTH